MNYLEFDFKVRPLQPWSDILIAQLGAIGFESFMETDEGILAYIQAEDFLESKLKVVEVLETSDVEISYNIKEIEQVNWNLEWEKNFQPTMVDDICCIRAPFHEPSNVKYDIVIEPKMSFGTGHHETTYMMVQHLLNTEFKNKSVLDMGCGTAVLAILAALKGAEQIDAIDIDSWCYLNSLENAKRNNCNQIRVFQGDVNLISDKSYDIIIANINKNILLRDLPLYAQSLKPDGQIFLSGFYLEDRTEIVNECKKQLLKLTETKEKNNWLALKFIN